MSRAAQLLTPHTPNRPAASSRTAEPAPLDLGGDRMGTFLGGVMTYNALHARMPARAYDFGAHRRVLDLAGLSGSFLAEALRAHPELRATFLSGGDLVGHAENTPARPVSRTGSR
ncbi:hypothetical protein [Embleya sp. AB8]|uniref:hypothetical protein n=1 Tax=Embleya sp. AB8 TaxID=3156304 RepID=UPI003C72ABE8